MRRERNVKILATLGPASAGEQAIEQLFTAGADAFRLNMSHKSHDDLKTHIKQIRAVETRVKRPIAVLVDLQGPKLRLGEIPGGPIQLEKGQSYTLYLGDTPGDQAGAPLPHPEIFKTLKPGSRLLINDGKVALKVNQADASKVTTIVERGGEISSRKGVNLPNVVLPLSAVTEKDRADLELALELGADWIAMSFIQTASDIREAHDLVAGRAAIMAKIEKPSALDELDAIIEIADGIMIARGDLGVEVPVENVPGLQRQITNKARQAGKPVVVATQMLESMITSPVPTRAEVSDVAVAVYAGADAVMLSAETAAGDYPVAAVAMMHRVACSVENDPDYQKILYATRISPEPTAADAISAAAHQVATTLDAAAIVCYSSSGSTSIRASRERPQKPIVTLTPNVQTSRKLTLVWGQHCVLTEDARDLDDMVSRACRIVYEEKIAGIGERIIITAGVPLRTPGTTNMMRVAIIKDEHIKNG